MISTFAAFLDANVLFGTRLRSLLMEAAQSGLFRARWSDRVHDEWIAAVRTKRPDIDDIKLQRVRVAMDAAVPDCLVFGFEDIEGVLDLPDPNDRHVLAAAIIGRASCIVTFNEADFPADVLDRYGLHTRHPDRFLLDLESLESGALIEAARADKRHYRNPPLTAENYIDGLRRAGLPETSDFLTRVKILLDA